MTDDEKYLFDLNGYLVIENVLTVDELTVANKAIDHHLAKGRIRSREESYAVPDWADERQSAVLQPPYHTRLSRPVLESE